MSYPKEYKEQVIQYRLEGHSQKATALKFGISMTAMRAWEKQFAERGEVCQPQSKRYRKIDPETFMKYVESHPQANTNDLAERFSCSATAIRLAFARFGIAENVKGDGSEN